MIKFNIQNLHEINPDHGLTESELSSRSQHLSDYLNKIHERDQGFYTILDDDSVIESINRYAQSVEGKYEHIVVLGIGGSALGPICLQRSLKHLYENEKSGGPKLHVIDNIDPELISAISDIINFEKTLFIVITKSGGTPETLSQYFYFRDQCDQKDLEAKDHFVFITDAEKGLLRKIANDEHIPSFEIPENVGGRFSVLTPVGLLPAKLIGIDIEKLIEGAKKLRDNFLTKNAEENICFQLAVIQYLLGEKGKVMNVMFPYSQKLIRLADWYRQLLAESIGKRMNNHGEIVHVGLTPINALGVTDQHSQSQLYNEGPNDKFFIFLDLESYGEEITIPNLFPDDDTVSYLNNVSFNTLIKTEKKATEQSITHNDRPNITITLDKVSEESLAELFLLFEGATAFLGELYNINAFDQPGVELSKKLTKEMLV